MFPFRRAYKFVKRIFTKKRKAPKRGRRPKSWVKKAINKHVTIKKVVINDAIQQLSPAGPNPGQNSNATANAIFFKLTDIPQYQSYVNLYEEFKIVKVKVTIKTLNNTALNGYQSNVSAFTTLGNISSILDTNDSQVGSVATNAQYLAVLNEFAQDDTFKSTKSNRDHTRTVYPRYSNLIGTNTAMVNGRTDHGWLECKDLNTGAVNQIPHMGIKMLISGGQNIGAGTGAVNFMYQYHVEFVLQFRNPY